MIRQPDSRTRALRDLLKPHAKALGIAIAAAIIEGAASLAEPWPLKIVLDNVVKSKPGHGWFNQTILSLAGQDRSAILKFAAIAVLVIAAAGAVCGYIEKYLANTA